MSDEEFRDATEKDGGTNGLRPNLKEIADRHLRHPGRKKFIPFLYGQLDRFTYQPG
jgi:hypothetical protein